MQSVGRTDGGHRSGSCAWSRAVPAYILTSRAINLLTLFPRCRRFEEQDVAMMSTVLRAAGLHLRAADPTAMKEFLVAVHSRAAEVAAAGAMSTRAEVSANPSLPLPVSALSHAKH